MQHRELPIPPHFDPNRVGEVWRVPYAERAEEALAWAKAHAIRPAAEDPFRVVLVAVDVQSTFCIPGFELYVGGRTGTGAVDDNRRLCRFLYRNLDFVTAIAPTMDTHEAIQIFHPLFLVDEKGEHPSPFTSVSEDDVRRGRWRFDPDAGPPLGIDAAAGQRHLEHYARELSRRGKYELTVWPYHAMLGGIGHALVPAVEEAIFFHTVARSARADFAPKGNNPLTEHYSVLGPEVTTGADGRAIAQKNEQFLRKLLEFDAILIAGQAKSHCVAWTIDDLLTDVRRRDESLVRKVYLLEDCSSPVVVPGVVDYTDQADAAFRRFAEAGMHVVRSTDPVATWPGMRDVSREA